jgi:DNA repair exonuclease SbcCD ATPase subunit
MPPTPPNSPLQEFIQLLRGVASSDAFNQAEEMEADLSELKKEYDNLKTSLLTVQTVSTAEIQTLRAEAEQQKANITNYIQEIKKGDEREKALDVEKDRLQKQLDAQKKDTDTEKSRNKYLLSSGKALGEKMVQKDGQITSLEARIKELEKYEKELKAVRSELAGKQKELALLQTYSVPVETSSLKEWYVISFFLFFLQYQSLFLQLY